MAGGYMNIPDGVVPDGTGIDMPRRRIADRWARISESSDIAIERDGRWIRWSTGPYVDRDLAELRLAGVPEAGEIGIEETCLTDLTTPGRVRPRTGRLRRLFRPARGSL